MSNGNLMQYDDGEVDDGFNGSFSSDRTIKGVQLAWNDALHWRTRDEQKPPAQLLVVGVDAILQRWKEGLPQVIRDKPLPDPDDLNAAIPVERVGNRHRRAEAPAVGGHGRRLLHRSGHGRFLHLRELDDRRPHRRRPSQGVGRRHANAARRPRPAGGHARRAADEDALRRQVPAAFRDRRLERGWRSRSQGRGAEGGLAAGVRARG